MSTQSIIKTVTRILCVITCLQAIGCTPSYYEAQRAYYEAQKTSYEAYIKTASKPIAEMIAPDGTRFAVNNAEVKIPMIRQSENPIVNVIDTVVNSSPAAIIAGGWSVSEIMKRAIGDTTTTTTTVNDSTAPPVVVQQPEPVVVQQPEPVVVQQPPPVEQPDPVIVQQPEPVIVQQPEPVIVQPTDPVIVTQPNPVIVTQP